MTVMLTLTVQTRQPRLIVSAMMGIATQVVPDVGNVKVSCDTFVRICDASMIVFK